MPSGSSGCLRSGLLAIALAFALAACGGDADGYPQESIDEFVRECDAQPNASEAQCRCVIARLQETMPFDEFERADRALANQGPVDEASLAKLQQAVEVCRS
jgi:hypothetical protein